MLHAAYAFATRGHAWIPEPSLGTLVPQALTEFEKMLAILPEEEVRANSYRWQAGLSPDPDDGIICKHAGDLADEAVGRTGLTQDNKVYIHLRLRTEDLFRQYGIYDPRFQPLFDLGVEIHARVNERMDEFFQAFAVARPDLGLLQRKAEESVLRLMVYEDVREDGLVGKPHTDKCDGTLHLYDSSPGLLKHDADGNAELIERRPGETFWFAGDRTQRLGGIPALRHGASHPYREQGRRKVAVFFLHNWHPSELAALAAK